MQCSYLDKGIRGTQFKYTIELVKKPISKINISNKGKAIKCSRWFEIKNGNIARSDFLNGTPTFFLQFLQVAGKIGPKHNFLKIEIVLPQ